MGKRPWRKQPRKARRKTGARGRMDGTGKRKDTPPRLLDRELSWLQFNARVQAEADQPGNPLLERAKFLAIVTSNLDEFMQVRYHRVLEAAQGSGAGRAAPCEPHGMGKQCGAARPPGTPDWPGVYRP